MADPEPEPQPAAPPTSYFPAFTPVMPPPPIGQGNFQQSPLVISSGGFGEPLSKTGGSNKAFFPDYTAGSPPFPNSVPATPPNIPPFVPWPPPNQPPFPSSLVEESPEAEQSDNHKRKGKRRK